MVVNKEVLGLDSADIAVHMIGLAHTQVPIVEGRLTAEAFDKVTPYKTERGYEDVGEFRRHWVKFHFKMPCSQPANRIRVFSKLDALYAEHDIVDAKGQRMEVNTPFEIIYTLINSVHTQYVVDKLDNVKAEEPFKIEGAWRKRDNKLILASDSWPQQLVSNKAIWDASSRYWSPGELTVTVEGI